MTTGTVAVYWGGRLESEHECANRLFRFLNGMGHESPLLGEWCDKKKPQNGPCFTTDAACKEGAQSLVDLVASGANRRDIDGQKIDTLGFRVGLWNMKKGRESASIGISCGLHSNNTGLGNCVVVDLPEAFGDFSPDHDEIHQRLLALLISSWDPDWGGYYDPCSDAFINSAEASPFLDKMLWIKDGKNIPPTIQSLVRNNNLLGGRLYIQTP